MTTAWLFSCNQDASSNGWVRQKNKGRGCMGLKAGGRRKKIITKNPKHRLVLHYNVTLPFTCFIFKWTIICIICASIKSILTRFQALKIENTVETVNIDVTPHIHSELPSHIKTLKTFFQIHSHYKRNHKFPLCFHSSRPVPTQTFIISRNRVAGAHRNQSGTWHKIGGNKKGFFTRFLFLFLIYYFQGIF